MSRSPRAPSTPPTVRSILVLARRYASRGVADDIATATNAYQQVSVSRLISGIAIYIHFGTTLGRSAAKMPLITISVFGLLNWVASASRKLRRAPEDGAASLVEFAGNLAPRHTRHARYRR